MIRTLDVAANLRIEVRRSQGRRHVVLVDPTTGEELLIAKDLQDSTINDLNNYIWHKLDDIAKDLEADPELGASYGATIACKVYKVGYAALLKLTRRKIDDAQEFCSLRIQKGATPPPIIDVVAQEDDHIFFEVMPLLGKAERCYSENPDAGEAASVLTGFNAVVRHRIIEEQMVRVTDSSSRVSVRFFQHTGLTGSVGELRQLRSLEKKGGARVSVSLQYPPRHFRPPPGDPEKELATRLANPWFVDAPNIHDGPGSVCHLSCHLRDSDGGAVLELRPDGRGARPVRYDVDMIDVAFHHVPIIPPHAKLCFVSACKSAAIDRKLLLSAMDALRELNPESIIGTLGSIPDITAARFALKFYESIGEGWSVGAAMWQAKRSLLEAPFHNPLGLVFVSYHGEDVQFAVPSDSRERILPDEVSAILATPTKGL